MKAEEIMKKLKAIADDTRGNDNERAVAQNQLRRLMEKYHLSEEDLEVEEQFYYPLYFREEWEHKLICQTLYKIVPDRPVYKNSNKRNWMYTYLTNAEKLEFELYYPAYKASFKKEFELFYSAFLSKNHIFPDKKPDNDEATNVEDKYSRGDLLRISMMAQGIETARVHKQIGDGNNGEN